MLNCNKNKLLFNQLNQIVSINFNEIEKKTEFSLTGPLPVVNSF